MRKIVMILAVMFAMPIVLCAQGINFENLSYKDALTKAKSENKLLFIDCYTTWCGPCKWLDKEVFPLKEAGDYFNDDYICVKIDMEKGEGPELKSKLGVNAYPTMMVISGDGDIVAKFSGGLPIKTIISRIETAKSNPAFMIHKKYAAGELSTQEEIEYVALLAASSERKKAQEVLQKIMDRATDKEKISKQFWPLYSNGRVVYYGTEPFDYVVKNAKRFKRVVGKDVINEYIFEKYFRIFIGNIWGNIAQGGGYSEEKLHELVATIERLPIDKERKSSLIAQANIAIAREGGDAHEMAVNMLKIEEYVAKDLWGYGSAFLDIFKKNKDAVSDPKVKELGAMLEKYADKESKHIYKRIFKL